MKIKTKKVERILIRKQARTYVRKPAYRLVSRHSNEAALKSRPEHILPRGWQVDSGTSEDACDGRDDYGGWYNKLKSVYDHT